MKTILLSFVIILSLNSLLVSCSLSKVVEKYLKNVEKNPKNVENKKKTSGTKFITGRIPPGRFEYSDLNGMYRTREAAKLCEKDPACAGFTFKGTPLNIGTLAKKKYEMYFFHFVPKDTFSEAKKQFYHWTSYVVKSRKTVELKKFQVAQLSPTSRTAVCLISER